MRDPTVALALVVRGLNPCALIRVQSWDAQPAAPLRAEETLGVAWPKTTGTESNGDITVLCVGPADWLLVAADLQGLPTSSSGASTPALVLQTLSEAFAGSTFRATDVSSALTRIQIEGANARALLAKGCSLDLHPQAFPAGRSARTRFAGMPVVVRCTEPSTFQCIVATSYREYLQAWLQDAALEF